MNDGQKSRGALRRGAIDVRDAAVADRAAYRHRVGHVLEGMVSGVARLPRHFQCAIFSADGRSDDGRAHDCFSPVDCMAFLRARTMARLASSILKALWRCGVAPCMAASAAARNVVSSAVAPVRTRS